MKIKQKPMKTNKLERERKRDKGDKKVQASISASRQMNNRSATFSSNGRNIRIKHREYLREVACGVDLVPNRPNVEYIECNPGIYSAFPWLSGIANQFESYTFHSLALHYVPSCSATTNGSVILAPDFDVSDYSPDSLMTLQTFPGSIRTSPWVEAKMVCPPDLLVKLVKERMIRHSEVADVDLKLYDVACFYIAHIGFSQTVNAGSLWIEYDVTLRTPTMDNSVDSSDSGRYYNTAANGVTKGGLFGTIAAAEISQDVYQPILKPIDSSTLFFERAGKYILDFVVQGTGMTNGIFTMSFPQGGGEAKQAAAVVAADGLSTWLQYTIDIVSPTALHLLANAAWTTVTALSMKASPYKFIL